MPQIGHECLGFIEPVVDLQLPLGLTAAESGESLCVMLGASHN